MLKEVQSEPLGTVTGAAAGLSGLAAQTAERRANMEALRSRGINPYPTRFERTATLAELRDRYAGLEPGAETGELARVAGRIISIRGHGGLRFATMEDVSGSIQLMFQADRLADDVAAVEGLVDVGDWVGATGEVISSRRGELSIAVTDLEMLSKALRPLPDKRHGVSDAETRYRQREVDLLANRDSRKVFDIRFKTLAIFRERLQALSFVEVETPILQPQAGGALARPFFTHANALDTEFSLRVAPELYLKRLVVGGMERVFEVARNFRNEGIDTRHSPEFTSLEAYRAFGDFNDGMDLTEHLIVEAARGAVGRLDFDLSGHQVDLSPSWPRRDLLDLLEDRLGQRVHPSMPVETLRSICEAHDVPHQPEWGSGKLVFELYDKVLMPQIIGPVFIYHYPTEVSPLARRSVEDPTVTDRFELVIGGRELANGYSELNDPDEQAARFRAEAAAAAGGDLEAHPGGRRLRAGARIRPATYFGDRYRNRPADHAAGRGPRDSRRHPFPDDAARGVVMTEISEIHDPEPMQPTLRGAGMFRGNDDTWCEVEPDSEGTDHSDNNNDLAAFFVPDLIEVEVGRGGRAIVISDLHLRPVPTAVSTRAADEVSQLLDGFPEPGVLVIAGDGFEMLAEAPAVDRILDAHPQFVSAIKAFADQPDHRVLVIPGNHDGQLAWDGASVEVLRSRLGVTDVSLACDLVVTTGDGPRSVRVAHGNQLDPYNAFEDPRSPVDTPFGHHVVREILPKLEARQTQGSLLEGIQWLDGDPTDLLGSRLLYRKVFGRLWWLAVPFAAALILRFLSFAPGVKPLLHHHTEHWLVSFGILMVAIAVIAAVVGIATMLRVNRALADASVSERGDASSANAAGRAEAARLVAAGYAGLITGHTHEPELSQVGTGFYANTGCGTEVVRSRKARFGLPRPFLAVRRLSLVELKAGPVLAVSLSLEEQPIGQPAPLERLVLAPERARPDQPGGRRSATRRGNVAHQRALAPSVGAAPPGPPGGRLRLAQRRPAQRAVRAALADPLDPSRQSLAALRNPSRRAASPQWSAGWPWPGWRGVRGGYRRAWVAALVILLVSTVNRLMHDVGLEGSAIACLLGLWLLLEHRHFRVSPTGPRRLLGWAVMGGLVAAAVAAGLDALYQGGSREARDVVLLTIVGTALLVLGTALPGREHRRTGGERARAFVRAREIFERYGGDTLDYFALRDDKSWLFTGNTLVAYSVINRIMLVSPDPIGPIDERLDAWSDAMELADANGWYVCVLGASRAWLPIYRAAGLNDVYMGDEAIVDCQVFSLKGKSMKSLRGAYNRVSKSGYHVSVMPSLDADDDLRRQLEALATETRQGETERGFSMTLSRMFDDRDPGLLLAVCFDPDGKPVAFNQYVPASHINGYSLDVMRRTSDPEAPNGLTDFVIIETINWMAERGLVGLGLNFATMRAVVADDHPSGTWRSLEKSLLHRFSDSMQIESLWNFNKKYDPEWRARYAVADDRAHMPRAGLAIARAESVSELPVVGKLMKPKAPADTRPAELVS